MLNTVVREKSKLEIKIKLTNKNIMVLISIQALEGLNTDRPHVFFKCVSIYSKN